MRKRKTGRKARPQKDAGGFNLQEVSAKVHGVLDLVARDEADELIGRADATAPLLQAAVQGEFQLLFGVLGRHGLRNTVGSQMAMAKAQLVMAQMMHNAYAAGIKRERNGRLAGKGD